MKRKMLLILMVMIGIAGELSSPLAAEKPEIFVQMGHTSVIDSVTFSPDGKYLLSEGGWEDQTVKLWEVSTGREIRTFMPTGRKPIAGGAVFSPDGKYVVVVSGGVVGEIKVWNTQVWNMQDGKETKTFVIEKEGEVKSIAFSPDGKYLAVVCDEYSGKRLIKIYDFKSGNLVKVLIGHTDYEMSVSVAFSPDGRYLVSGSGEEWGKSKDNTVRLWDVKTGKEIKRFTGHTDGVRSVAFSPDGGYLASGSQDKTIILWNIKSGKKERIFNDPYTVTSIAFSPDGKYLVSATRSGVMNLWDVSNGQNIRNILIHKDDLSAYTYRNPALSSDGGYIAVVKNEENTIKVEQDIRLLDAVSGLEVRKFGGDIVKPCLAYFSSGGKEIRVVRVDGTMNVDILHGTINNGERQVGCRLYDGGRYFKKTAGRAGDTSFGVIVDSKTDKEVMKFDTTEASNEFINRVLTFSDDGRVALLSDEKNGVTVFDIDKKKNITTLESSDARHLTTVAFSPDGRYVVTLNSGGVGVPSETSSTLSLWDTFTGKQLKTFKKDTYVLKLKYTSDGEYILFGDFLGGLKLWDPRTGKEIRSFRDYSDNGRTWNDGAITFSPDDKYILSGEDDGTIKLLDFVSGKEKKTFTGHTSIIVSVAFSPDDTRFLSSSADGTIRLWDISTGKELAQFISFTDGEWVIITPEGYFNASPNGAKHLNVRVGNNVYSIDNFYEKFFNPVYVASVLQGKQVEAVADIRKGVLTPPDVKITSPEPNKEFSTDTITITVSAKDTGGGIDEIKLYHNGKAIGEDTRAVKIVPKGNEAIKTYTVTLVDGLNNFRAAGFSKDRTESNPYELIVKLTAPSKDVSLYIFAVGINKYKNPVLNLNYAEPDARGIVDFFKQKGKGLFKNVEIRDIYNEQATKEGIISKLKQLENTNPQDAVLIYLAGHGENINDKWYFIPHELTYPEREEDVKTKGISSDELAGYIKSIKAQKLLLLIDACKSGALLIAFRGFEDRKALSQLSRSTGVHIVAASTKDQFAAEVKELGHGVFTYILLEGLKGKAVGNGEAVTVRKLMGYIEEKLPEITKKYKQEAQFPVVDSRGMDFPLVIGR